MHFLKPREAVIERAGSAPDYKVEMEVNFFKISDLFFTVKYLREKSMQTELFHAPAAPYASRDSSFFSPCMLPQPSCVYAVSWLSVQMLAVGVKDQRCFPAFFV